MQTGSGGLQVPQHELQVVHEGGQQKLRLSVQLPGLSSASDIQLVCSNSSIVLTVPGRYTLLLPLDVTISDAADSVTFKKKKQTLTAKFTVLSGDAAAAAAVAAMANGSSSSSSTAKQQPQQQQQQQQADDAAQRAAAAAASQEAARREQQQRLNSEAAEEWLRRGLEAARSGNSALADKALGKVKELAPHLNTAGLAAAIAAAKQPQQQQQQGGQQGKPQQQQPQQRKGPQAAAAGAGANSSSSQEPRQQQQQQSASKQQGQQPPGGGASQPGNINSSSSGQQQHGGTAGAGAQHAGNTNSSSSNVARPGNQQQQKQQQKQQPKHKGKQRQPPSGKQSPPPPPPQQQQQQGASSSNSSSANASNGPSQQQQQQQQQQDEDEEQPWWGDRLVGWWCRQFDAVELWVFATGELLNAWSKEYGRGRVAYLAAQLAAMLLVAAHFAVVWLWRTGWSKPLEVAARIRRTGGDTFIQSQYWLNRTAVALTQHTLAAVAGRIALCCVSGACTAAAAWAVGWMQLGGHSVVGWALVLLRGTWRALVWRPWHSVQLPLAIVAVFVFGFAGLGGTIALWSLAMLLLPGGWWNLGGWLLAAAASMRLLPGIRRITWPTSTLGIMLLSKAAVLGCSWAGWKVFSSSDLADPLSRVSWWWYLLLLALHVFTGLMKTAEKIREEEAEQQGGSFGRSQSADDEPFYGGASDIAYQKFVMGFGPVAVPEGCEVAEVKVALQARDYYQVMGFASRQECTPESLRAARKAKALAVHPDKVGHDHPGANQAAGRVNKAYETLSSEESRRAYDRLLDCHSRPSAAAGPGGRRGAAAAAAAAAAGFSPKDAAPQQFKESLYNVERSGAYMCDMGCPNGDHSHTVYILPQAPFGVRWCRECEDWHNTRESGEVWAHYSPGLGGVRMLGRVRLLLAPSPQSPIFDITDLFKCGGRLSTPADMCNAHFNPLADVMAAPRSARRGGGGGYSGADAGTSRRSKKKQGRRR
uniref:J domain-containing protein n=2 Tax=Tetradesmus obliquus TaxID=3088 RepID=A0A383V990_TETOB|eukprot:jgi/Sobl393_1/16263/SZX62147.1